MTVGKVIGSVFSWLMALVGLAVAGFGVVRGEAVFVVTGLALAAVFGVMLVAPLYSKT